MPKVALMSKCLASTLAFDLFLTLTVAGSMLPFASLYAMPFLPMATVSPVTVSAVAAMTAASPIRASARLSLSKVSSFRPISVGLTVFRLSSALP